LAQKHIPEIDGLRAFAVLSVVLFHLNGAWLQGGYLGVDVFFVISGFLITTILWRDMTSETHAILKFYHRRIRRIMPVLLVVLLASFLFAFLLLLPSDFMGYAKSLIATLLFFSNVYFWRDTGYFSAAAEQKPLLHTWSLGVEEQFYLLFPLVLFFVIRFAAKQAFGVIAILIVASFALNVFLNSIGGNSPAFFMLPTRAWELGIGAAVAIWPSALLPQRSILNRIPIVGLALLVMGIVWPLETYGVVPAALPVVIGTGLLILGTVNSSHLLQPLLNAKPPVFVGQISFSLYLWHWPIIVFSEYYLVRELLVGEMALAVLLMFFLSVVTWRFVELPFRSNSMSKLVLYSFTGALVFTSATLAILVLKNDGVPSRLSAEAARINAAVGTNYRCPVANTAAIGQSRACLLDTMSSDIQATQVVLLGNSHMQMYVPVWKEIIKDNQKTGLLVPLNGCLPTVIINDGSNCVSAAQTNLEQVLKLPKLETVVLGMNWFHDLTSLVDSNGKAVEKEKASAVVAGLEDLILKLQDRKIKVVLIGPIEVPGWDIASEISRKLAFGWPIDKPENIALSSFDAKFGQAVKQFEGNPSIAFAQPHKALCDQTKCYFIRDGASLFADSNHIAEAELYWFKGIFAEAFRLANSR
jgi:peptidoglycan/LPS O-acetylase OafA/YrhL